MIEKFLRLFQRFRDIEASNLRHLENQSRHLREIEAQRLRVAKYAKESESLNQKTRILLKERTEAEEGFMREQQDRIRVQDRLDSAIQDRDKLWDLVKESLAGERYALQTQVNHANQKMGGGVVYPDAHSLPSNAVPKAQEGGPIGRTGRFIPSQAAGAATTKALEEYAVSQLQR